MSEERVTERVDAQGNVTERTVERGNAGTTVVERRGGGGVVIAIIALFAIAVLGYFLLNGNSETRKDDAVAEAVGKAGDSAQKIGDAAEKAADKLSGE